MLKPTKDPTPEDLRKNILSTYFFLRTGIVAISAALPISLLAYSLINVHALELHSMSAFYGGYDGAMRNWFVGSLCAIGAFLILYRGFTFAEAVALDTAGFFAILVAMKPCNCWMEHSHNSKLHLAFAFLFFGAMAYVCLFCATTTLPILPDPATRRTFRRKYRGIGISLIVLPLVAAGFSYATTHHLDILTFVAEWFGVWVFAYYWLTKTQEFEISSAEKKALRGELQYVKGVGLQELVGPSPPPR